MSDFVDEDHCALCSRVPPSERDAFRASLDRMPLKEPVCDACLVGVVCGRGRNPTLRSGPSIFSCEIDVFPSEWRDVSQ